MAQYDMNAHDYFRIIRKRKWIIILTTLAVYISAIAYTKMQTKLYKTSAVVEVVQKTKMQTDFGVDRQSFTNKNKSILEQAPQVIKSRAVAIRVINELGLIDQGASQAQINEVIDKLKDRIKVTTSPTANVVRIGLISSEPAKAMKIVNYVAEAYRIESDKRAQYSDQLVLDYLKEQLAIAEENTKNAKFEYLKFKEAHIVELSQNSEVNGRQISELANKITDISEKQEIIKDQLKKLKAYLSGQDVELSSIEILNKNQDIQSIKNQIERYKTELQHLTDIYMLSHPKIYALKENISRLQEKLNMLLDQAVSSSITRLEKQLAELMEDERIAKNKRDKYEQSLLNLPEIQLELEKLKKKYEVNQDFAAMFKKRLEETKIIHAGQIGDIRVIQPARIPDKPFYPNERKSALAGLVIGLILGFAFAFMVESMDTSIGTIEDVEKYIQKPVLGVIPHIKVNVEKVRKLRRRLENAGEIFNERQARLVAICDPKSPVTEAYRTLRTNLQFALPKRESGGYTLLISSATPQEGKSTTITNMAVIFSQAGKKTLVMSCNLRHPSVYKIFGVKKKPGITDILAGSCTWQEAIQDPGIDNLRILSAGPYPPNPSEILQSNEFKAMVEEIRQEFDVILFDSPPILPVTDAAVLGSHVDAVLLIYFVGKAAREALMRAKIQMENVDANIVGIVLNDIKSEGKLAYTYYYHYQYKYYGVRDASEV